MKIFKKNKLWFNFHLILSFVFGFFILLMCFTGGLLSYKTQINEIFYKDLSFVQVQDSKQIDTNLLVKNFLNNNKGLKITSLTKYNDLDKATRIIGNKKGTLVTFFINPYDGSLIGEKEYPRFWQTIINLHYALGGDFFVKKDGSNYKDVGNKIALFSTLVFVLILLSGFYIFVKANKKRFFNAFKMHFKAKGYSFLYRFHAVFGMWSFVVMLIICFSTLYWGYKWFELSVDKIVLSSTSYENKYNPSKKNEKTDPNRRKESRKMSISQGVGISDDLFKKELGNQYKELNMFFWNLRNGGNIIIKYISSKNEKNSMIIDVIDKKISEHKIYHIVQKNKSFGEKITDPEALHFGYFFGPMGTFIWFIFCFFYPIIIIVGYIMMIIRLQRFKNSAKINLW